MPEKSMKDLDFEQYFDINDVSFENVSKEFENRFRHRYSSSLSLMSGSRGRLNDASGANSLGILEEMAQRIDSYDANSDFEENFEHLLKEHELISET